MNNTVKILIGFIVAIFAVIALVAGVAFNANNTGNRFEQALIAERDNNRNILSNYSKKIAEAAQIPEMQRDDFIKVVKATMEGRYGPEGSKATFQFIKESQTPMSTEVYTNIQRMIESGRNEFRNGQTKMISVKQTYQTQLGSMPGGFFLSMMGYPKVNLADFDIVSDNRTEEAFKTHREEAIKLR